MTSALRVAFLTEDPRCKAELTLVLHDTHVDETDWPDRPGRPAAPRLVAAREVPKRRAGSADGRIALLHALAHIELNAIDLALDIVGRFAGDMGAHHGAFTADWLGVAREEAKHFAMLAERLVALGTFYGALPAHDGLWQSALATRHDLLGRLALAPLVHEARGLDVTPGLIAKLREAGDEASARILDIIYRDEIGHVATGHRWFVHVCAVRGDDPEIAFSQALARIGLAQPHAPFNEPARRTAGLTPGFDVAFVLR